MRPPRDFEAADRAYTAAMESLKRTIAELDSITKPARSTETAAGFAV